MPDERALDDLVEAVRGTARREIMPRFRRLSPGAIATKSGPHDLVTEADLAAEAALSRDIARILPQAAVIGEERVARDPAALDELAEAELAVIVDPIDGTANFAAGLALFGLIVAVVARGETVFGLLYDPVMDDWVVARRGAGAWLEGAGRGASRLSTGGTSRMQGSTGLVPLNALGPERRAPVMARFEAAGQVQDLRCSCHDYRLLATGEADFMVSVALNPWDHAAGQLVVQEAGGWSTVGGDRPYSPLLRQGCMVAACTQRLGAEVSRVYFPDRPRLAHV
ncbi:inositol monophosphatase family protein [Thetidibacter halocola]|uniref:Inositol monophosphatase n=1 Tax=Thetidibacter halocola TaxID=2827239 RepID=A0A8J8B9B5_9RHOB|nr:inositol monophosphatase [Thetidibacter halocola]MBS0125385.1 inositol monophosphatase [Thetidibacter halocola]